MALFWHVQYVDPTVDRLDLKHCIRYRLSRAATKYQDGKHYRVCSYFYFIMHEVSMVGPLIAESVAIVKLEEDF